MSVLLPKEENSNTKMNGNMREKSPRQKSGQTNNKQQNRDSLHLINEKKSTNAQPTEQDEDSETENLSPLLYKNKKSQLKHGKKIAGSSSTSLTTPMQFQTSQQIAPSQTALHIDGVNESIDDTDTDLEERDMEVKI